MCLVQSPRAVPASRASPCLRSKMCYVCRAVPACRACVSGCAACAVPFACRAVPAFQGAKKSRAVHECSAVPAWRAMPASIRKEKICSAWPCPRTVPAYRARAPCHAAPRRRSRMRKIFRAVPRRVRVLCRVVPCQRAVPCLLLNMRKMCSTAPCSLTMPHRAAPRRDCVPEGDKRAAPHRAAHAFQNALHGRGKA